MFASITVFLRVGLIVFLSLTLLASCRGGSKELSAPISTADAPSPYPADRYLPARDSTRQQDYRVTGEYVLTAGEHAGIENIRQALAAFNLIHLDKLGRNYYLIRIDPDPGLEIVTKEVLRSPAIKAVQPNFIYRAQ